jgi:hypothetical protein
MNNNKEQKTDMNKKMYTAPKMETVMIETQGVIAASNSLNAGTYGDGDGGVSEQPDVDSSGSIFGD